MADQNYDSMTKDELHDLLSDRGLPVSGTKDEMIARLQGSDPKPATKNPDPDDPRQVAGSHTRNTVVGVTDPDAVDAAQAAGQ